MDFRAELAAAEAILEMGDYRGAIRRTAGCFEVVLRETCRRFLEQAAGGLREVAPLSRQRLAEELRPSGSWPTPAGGPEAPALTTPDQIPHLFTLVAAAGGSGLLAWLNPALGPDEVAARLAFWREVARLAGDAEDPAEPRVAQKEGPERKADGLAAPVVGSERIGAAGAADLAAVEGRQPGLAGREALGVLEAQLVLSALRVLLGELGELRVALPEDAAVRLTVSANRPTPTRDRNGVAQPDGDCARNGDGVWEKRFDLGEGVDLALVWVPPGEFWMGSRESEQDRFKDEGPRHRVTIRRGFWLGKYAVTQRQWEAVMEANPSHFKKSGLEAPVECVSWDECQECLQQLNGRVRAGVFRLPSETEWEYACRAGTETPFAFGDSLSADMANFGGHGPYSGAAKGQNREQTVAVGSFAPNGWGLYDMHGNVYEWCEDQLHLSFSRGPVDESAWARCKYQKSRMIRGGSWRCSEYFCRSNCRKSYYHNWREDFIGFRLAWSTGS